MESSSNVDDVLIVGGGLAGLFCALKLAPRPVTILTEAPIGRGASSVWAQGGIAAAIGDGDDVEAHVRDTIMAGAGLVDEKIARLMASQAPARIHDLLSYGVPFDRDLSGVLTLSREAAHSHHRIVRVRGDMAGRAIMAALGDAVAETPSIRVHEGFSVERLMVGHGGVEGVVANKRRSGLRARLRLPARAVILATGGIGHLYGVTTNPAEATGQGIAMAAREGAIIADPEFVQFHPTALDVGQDPAPLATEALRGEGAILVDGEGRRFMSAVHPDAELAPRDVVARAVFEAHRLGGAYLDCREAIGDAFPELFPTVYASCRAAGIDPRQAPIPVAPAAHYHMGGIHVDACGRSSINGLWACGETASTGAHGANRLASNSLLEAVVFAALIAEDVADQHPYGKVLSHIEEDDGSRLPIAPEPNGDVAWKTLRATMSRHVGVVRSSESLSCALETLDRLRRGRPSPRLENALTAARLVAHAALMREESRGGHYRSDFPEPCAAPAVRSFLTLDQVKSIAGRSTIERREPERVHS